MELRRIEAALARLEAAAQQPRREPSADPAADLAPKLAQLEASNARLREAVGRSLRQIDALIARNASDQQP